MTRKTKHTHDIQCDGKNNSRVAAPCDLCGSDNHRSFMRKDDMDLVRCETCGLVYVNPRPTIEYLKSEVYNEGYFNAEKGFGIEDAFGEAEKQSLLRAERVLKRVEEFAPPGAALDVGCASGSFMRAAIKRGWTARGIEISEYAAQQTKTNHNLDVSSCDFISADLPVNAFDLVLMMDLIEHLTSPRKGVEKANNILKPDGLLVIETPNITGPAARALGAEWGLISPLHHLFYFSPETLKRLLSDCGFCVESLEFPSWGLADVLFSAGSFKKAGLPIGEKEKQFARTKLRFFRDAARGAANMIDRALLAPLTRFSNGNVIRIIARKMPPSA